METWTKQQLHDLVTDRLRGLKLIAVSNREPYIHSQRTECCDASRLPAA